MADTEKKNESLFRIVVAGGGTGGHVYPTLAVIDALIARLGALNAPYKIYRIGPKDGYEGLFANRGVENQTIVAGKVRRYFSLANFVDIPKFFIGLVQALAKLLVIMPDVVFSKGGTGALPVVIAAWFYRIPIAVHESDTVPGLTNLFSAGFARKVFVSFESAAPRFNAQKTEVTGTPIRASLLADRTTKELAKEALGFNPSQPLMLVLGGSQGSQKINLFILQNLTALIRETQIMHQTGVANFAETQRLAHAVLIDESFGTRYQPVAYFDNDKNLNLALTAADFAVARAGAGTISELAAFGVPAILIPLASSANDHQRANAYDFAKNGAAVVIEEANLLPGIFMGQLGPMLTDAERRSAMSAASAARHIPDAADKIAQALIQFAV